MNPRKTRLAFLVSGALSGALLLTSCGGGSSGEPTSVGPTPGTAGEVASITYAQATPATIQVTGLGKVETAVVRFTVRDSYGNPARDGTAIDFTLQGPNGGEYIGVLDATPTTASGTATGGAVEVALHSGRTAGTVIITARAATPTGTVTGLTPGLSIGGGVPAGNRFGLTSSRLNVPALDFTGTLAPVLTARLADRFGNTSALSGLSVSFYSEAGGAVTSPAITVTGGTASTTFLPRSPTPSDGFVTVMAYADGEEAFTDQNGNGMYDLGEPFVDLPEPYLDGNDNGTRDANEFYIDANANGVWDSGNGVWDGPLCVSAGCRQAAAVWGSARLMLTGNPVCTLSSTAFCIDATAPMGTCANGITATSVTASFSFSANDALGHPPPQGTSIAVTVSGAGTLGGMTTYTLPDTQTATPIAFTLTDGDGNTTEDASTVTVTVTPPAGSGLTGCTATAIGGVL